MLNFAEDFDLLTPVQGSDHKHFTLKDDSFRNDLYVYSTSIYLDREASAGENFSKGEVWLKIGDTPEQEVKERVSQQDDTSNPEPLELQVQIDNVDFRDHDFHSFLEDQNETYRVRKFVDGKDREWFSFETKEDFWKLLNAFINDTDKRPDSYGPRKHQKKAMKKMFNAWDYGYDEFLLAAKMRFGKNFTTMTHIRDWHEENKEEGEVTRVFFTSYKPNVFSSLEEDINDHVFFENVEVINLKDSDKNTVYRNELPEPETDADIVVYLGSAQLVLTNTDDGDPYKVLEDEHFDFMIADEVHYGGNTWNFNQHLIDENLFTYDKLIWMTGTPFKFARVRSFSDRNSYYFTYIEEQKLKKSDEETWADGMPTLKFHMVDISERAVENQNRFFNEEERFRLKKLFETNDDGELVHRPSVKMFFKQIKNGFTKTDLSPYRMCSKSDHSLWMLPRNVDAVKAAADLLREMDLYNEFKVFVAAGEGQEVIGSDEIDEIKTTIKNDNLADNTITLTCGRFKEGTTVEEWHMALMMNDGKSIEDYFQTAFRTATPTDDKEFTHVFDFNPERTLEVMFEGTEGMRKAEDMGSHTELIREMLDCAHVIDHRENGFNTVEAEDVMDNCLETADHSEKIAALGNVNTDIDNPRNLNLDESRRTESTELNENDTDGGKQYDVDRSGTPNDEDGEEDETSIADMRRQIQTALQNLARYLLVSSNDEESVKEVIETADPEQFERHVGISLELFKEVAVPNIRAERVDLRIQEFTYYQNKQKEENGLSFD